MVKEICQLVREFCYFKLDTVGETAVYKTEGSLAGSMLKCRQTRHPTPSCSLCIHSWIKVKM